MVTLGSLRLYSWPLMPLLAAFVCSMAAASEPPTIDMIRERIEAIGVRSSRSADGHLVVSGPDSFENAILLAWGGEVCERVESVVGVPMPFDARSVRLLVSPADTNRAPVSLEHGYSGGLWNHRITLPDYAAIQSRDGVDAVCAAFLALYIPPAESGNNHLARFSVPSWLVQGVAQVLTEESRDETLDTAIGLWREGRLPPLLQIMSDRDSPGPESDDSSRLYAARGALVLWLTGMAADKQMLTGLFQSLAEGRDLDGEWLQEQLADEGNLDELWDRWMLSQRHVVRSLGRLTLAHMDALLDAWDIQPGIDGIPWDVTLPSGADCMRLLQYRDQPWVSAVIRQKRYRIEMLAQGRPGRFRELVTLYVNVLNAIESGERPPAVVGLAVKARRQWQALLEIVQQAGGTWSEPGERRNGL